MYCAEGIFFLAISSTFFRSAVSVDFHTETVLAGNALNLTCTYNGKGDIAFYRWSKKSVKNSPFLVIDSDCLSSYYETPWICNWTCINNTTLHLTISNITAQDHETTLICQVNIKEHGLYNVSETQILVKVPVQYVQFSPHFAPHDGYIPENTSINMVCYTSYSRPTPNIRWFLDPGTESKEDDSEITFGVFNTTSENDKLYSLNSTLTTPFKRNVYGWQIYCSASNVPGQLIDSEKFLLNISYPPDGPPIIGSCVNCQTYKIIENTQGRLTCTSTGGNPLPQLTWECFYTEEHASVAEDTVTTTLLINASKQKQGVCSCFSKDVYNKRRTTSIIIDVLYPPEVPVITYYNGIKMIEVDELKIIENSSFSLSCNAKGNPTPKYTWWDPVKHLSQNYSSAFERHQNGNLTCYVSNIMRPNNQKELSGSNSKTIAVNILYPPEVKAMTKQSVTEHTDVNILCQFTRGNPPATTVKWTRNKKTEQEWKSEWLSLKNVSKENDDEYTCSVSNTMTPTGGHSKVVQSSKTFHLSVLYKATVTAFYVVEVGIEAETVVTPNSTVTFRCNGDANPLPKVEISFLGHVQSRNNTSTHLEYKKNVTCADAGLYMCSARNYLNDEIKSNQSLTVIVLCTPRPSPFLSIKDKVATPLHSSATFHFKAREYLDKQRPSFFWKKVNHSQLIGLSENAIIKISASGLQTNLTISNIAKSDYGTYLLVTNNSKGVYKQQFQLIPDDIPEVPRNFEVVATHVTTSTALVRWISGFHGGHAQTFVLKYKSTTENNWNNVTVKDRGTSSENAITIKGLSSSTWYEIKMYAQNTLGSTNTTVLLQFQTKATANEFTIPLSTGMIVGCIFGILLVTAGIVLSVIIYKKRSRKVPNNVFYENVQFTGNRQVTREKSTNETNGETSIPELNDSPPSCTEPTEYANSSDTIENLTEIMVSELFVYVSERKQESYNLEYTKLPNGLQKPCTDATKPDNIALNRYRGLYPYDHSRVKIRNDPDFYMNACYINGNAKPNAYIASLGPTVKETAGFKTFWQMVWFENVDIIVMLTNLHEPSGMKCEEYWPQPGTDMSYGNIIRVACKKMDEFAEYTVRYFTITNLELSKKRRVTQLHYTAWPDKTVPEDVASLLDFRQKVKATHSNKKGPVVVHCSAGIGRTGTFIALDRLIEQGQNNGFVNVFECVRSMREQRVNMVQTLEQYIYIHKALVHSLYFDFEMIRVEEFQPYIYSANDDLYIKQYKELDESVETMKKGESDARAVNTQLVSFNRHRADIPGNQHRVRLFLNRDGNASDYINAVYVNSLMRKDHFITAQSPLPDTVLDFVCMIYQENCYCVVTFDNTEEPGMVVGKYLPEGDDDTLSVGDFQVSVTVVETKPQYTIREMKIKCSGQCFSGERITYHFQYHKWPPGSDVPPDPMEFVQFFNVVEDYASQLHEEKSHMLVHCLKANERSALYCIIAILIEKIRNERQVNVLNTIRHFRTRRMTAVTSMEQLKFCYNAVSAYISTCES